MLTHPLLTSWHLLLQKMLLCERLYALHFQFLQLFESYLKLVRKVATKSPMVVVNCYSFAISANYN